MYSVSQSTRKPLRVSVRQHVIERYFEILNLIGGCWAGVDRANLQCSCEQSIDNVIVINLILIERLLSVNNTDGNDLIVKVLEWLVGVSTSDM